MIGCYEINRSIPEPLPQLVAVLAAADRRRALEQCRPIRDAFGCQMQVMRASFHSYGQPLGARRAQRRERLARRKMNDMQLEVVLSAERHQ